MLLDHISDWYAKSLAVSEIALNQVSAVAGKNCDLVKTVFLCQLDLICEQGFAGKRYHWLGQIAESRPQAYAHSTRQNDNLLRRVHRLIALEVLADRQLDGFVRAE